MRYTMLCSARVLCILGFAASALSAATPAQAAASSLPTVDLGYAIHQAHVVAENPNFFNFSNIRYAAPPLGALRFTAPAPPLNNRSAGVQDGSFGKICPQAIPGWSNMTLATAPPGENESEDCLFLDVIVSNTTFNARQSVQTGKAPVMVWFYGGGYVQGSRFSQGDPIGLLERSREHSPGAIFVAFNYRLGAFGWLSGPVFQSNATANAGLHDQLAVLNWVQTNIHLFGGDPNRVTVMGESAGAGGIMHHLAAFGGAKGDGSSPFQQAVLQSPALHNPTMSKFQEMKIVDRFLQLANVTTINEARNLSSLALQMANKAVLAEAPFGLFTFEPTVDGTYVPNTPGVAFLTGAFDHAPTLLLAHNKNEGHVYTDPNANFSNNFTFYMNTYLPASNPEAISFITDTLYPAVYDGSQPYTTPFDRLDLAIGELMLACNARFMATAHAGNTFNYVFAVGTGFHGSDVPYTFYDENNANPSVVNASVAIAMQRYFTSFVETGSPNGLMSVQQGDGLIELPMYGANGTVLQITTDANNALVLNQEIDPVGFTRCDWWEMGLYL